MTQERNRKDFTATAPRPGWMARIMVSAETLNRIQFDAPWRRPDRAGRR